MNRFSRLSALWASFYSRDLYRDVATRWKGVGLLYLALLLALCWLPSAARWYMGLRQFAAAATPVIVSRLPTIAIEGGVMTANPAGRHVIPLELGRNASDKMQVVIDDSIDSAPNEAATDTFVLTRHEIGAIRPSRSERRIWTLTPAADRKVTPEEVGAFINALALWVPPIGYAGAFVGSLAFRLLQALLYGAMAMAYARTRRVTLDYAAAVRLAAVAVTPVVVIRTLLWFGPWPEPSWFVRWPVAFLATLAFIAFGVRAAASSSTGEADTMGGPSI